MKNEVKNDTKVLKSKRFVVRLSLVGKNQVIEFTNKKGDVITYNHDIVYEVMKEKLSTLPCWTKYKSYTATGNIPMSVRNIELVQKYTDSRLEVEKHLTSINNTNVNVVLE